jgi:DUF971 family protein
MSESQWGSQRWPVEIRVKRAEKLLEIDFDDGTSYSYPAELLRVESPSAEVQGHSAAMKTIVPGKRDVGIVEVEPVGHYAVRIRFDDGHASGIFSWRYLDELGRDQGRIWKAYLDALAAKGLSRAPFSS